MTIEEAWLFWIKTSRSTTDPSAVTDFEVIKKSSWWAAFEAGWDLASVNLNGWDQAYAMGVQAGKEIERDACASLCSAVAAGRDAEAIEEAIRARNT
jgi:hypothetical protein